MDDGILTTESGIMDQRPKKEANEGNLASTMAGRRRKVAVDQWQRTEEANAGRVSSPEKAASGSLFCC